MMKRKSKFLIFLLMFLITTLPLCSQESENSDYKEKLKRNMEALNSAIEKKPIKVGKLKEIIIHESGRLKPLDSYARTMLLIFSGRSTYKGKDAISWLAQVMWEPEKTVDQRIFKITYDQVLVALGIKPNKSRRYTYNELVRGIPVLSQLVQLAQNKSADYRTPADKEFLRIYDNFILYNQIMNSFLYSLPIQTFLISAQEVKKELGIDTTKNYFSYTDIMRVSDKLQEIVKTINTKKNNNLEAKEILTLELKQKYDSFLRNFSSLPFRFFPSYTHGKEKWFSAWELFGVSGGSNIMIGEIDNLDQMVKAYLNRNQEKFDKNIDDFLTRIDKKVEDKSALNRISAELLYNTLSPFYRAQLILGVAFLLILAFFVIKYPLLRKFSFWLLVVSMLFTLVGVINRFVIVMRPPITNLFETFVFVALLSIILGLLIEKFQKRGLGILSGIFSGLVLLLISNNFAANGDTMDVLVAVLRSNFWLSTHVITINIGYAGIFLSGVIGHFYLFQCLNKKTQNTKLKNTYRVIYAIQAFGLIFTLIGTILGGVWADQSWGRFWGWDPKENGSLMIVLWSVILFHARFDGLIKDIGYAIGSILGIVVLMIAWFGINLLGVGLHSYGFIAGIAYTLYSYIAGQIMLVIVLYAIIGYRKQNRSD